MPDAREQASLIVLVRHARPVIEPGRPAGEWALDNDYASDITSFVEMLRPLGIDGVVTSPEPKALGTAHLIATALGLPLREEADLREQGAGPIPWFEIPDDFRRAVADHFQRRDEAVLGGESSADAARRFAGAVEGARSRFRCPALVTHGRVMSGYLGEVLDRDPVPIWSDLRMPDALMFDLDVGTLIRIDEKMEE